MDNSGITNSSLKKSTEHPAIELIVRSTLAAVFLVAALTKINTVTDFSHSILNYRIFSSQAALFIATVLPWLELFCSVALLLGIYQRAATIIVIALLSLFTLLVLWALILGLDISCGCFTQDPQADKIGWLKIAENCGLLLLAAYLLLRRGTSWTIFTLFHTEPPTSSNEKVSDDTSSRS